MTSLSKLTMMIVRFSVNVGYFFSQWKLVAVFTLATNIFNEILNWQKIYMLTFAQIRKELFFGKSSLIRKSLHLVELYACSSELSDFSWSENRAIFFFFFNFNWDSFHARLNSHYEAWSYKKRSTKKITGYRKSI